MAIVGEIVGPIFRNTTGLSGIPEKPDLLTYDSLTATALVNLSDAGIVESGGNVVAMTNTQPSGDKFAQCFTANGDYFSTPSSTALNTISGEMEIIGRVRLPDYSPATGYLVASRFGGAGQRAWTLQFLTDGSLRFTTSTDGTNTSKLYDSSVALPTTNNDIVYLKVTFLGDNGSSDSEVYFYYSSDGVAWTQLGTVIQKGSADAIYSGSTVALHIGGNASVGLPLDGSVYSLSVAATIDGPPVVDFNPNDYANTGNANWASSSTGEVWTIQGNNYVVTPRALVGTGAPYANLPGSAGDYFSSPDSVANSVTGDIDIRCDVALDDWTPAVQDCFLAKRTNALGAAYHFYTGATGQLEFYDNTTVYISSVASGITDGSRANVRVTRTAADGVVKFYLNTSGDALSDSTVWTQLGADVAGASGALRDTAAALEIGSYNVGIAHLLAGTVYRAQIYNGIDGTKVIDFDPIMHTNGSTFYGRTGETWTANGNAAINGYDVDVVVGTGANLRKSISDAMLSYGAATDYASSPDSAAASITGDIDVRFHGQRLDWTPSGVQEMVIKWLATGNQRSYYLYLTTSGNLELLWSTTGANTLSATSTVANNFVNGSDHHVRVTLDVDNGAGGYTVTFYTSDDGEAWTQLGDAVIGGSTTSIFDSTATVLVAASAVGNGRWDGSVYRAQVYNGIDGDLAVDFNAADYASNARRNLLTYSQEFDNAAWTKFSGATITPNTVSAPDGTNTADTLTSTGASQLRQDPAPAIGDYTGSVYLKAGTTGTVRLQVYDGTGASGYAGRADFDLSSGTITATVDGVATIEDAGDGWYRCSVAGDIAATSANFYILPATGTIYVWGAQVESGLLATTYQRVDSAASTAEFISSDTFEGWTLNGNTFIQNTGKDVVHSIGSAGLETTAGQTIASGATVFAVVRSSPANPSLDQYFIDSRSNASARFILSTDTSAGDSFGIYQGGAAFVNLAAAYDTDAHVLTGQFNGDATTKLTGSSVGSIVGDAGSANWDYGTILSDYAGTQTVQGYIAQLVVFDRALTEAEIAVLQKTIADRYAGLPA
jgi:hypothetical protein